MTRTSPGDPALSRTLDLQSAPTTAVRDFEILGALGRGGMGTVYRARQPRMDRDVALKELSFEARPDLAARFLQEARIGGSLAHPNIIVVYDYFEAGEGAFIAMELAERGPLTPLMGSLTVPQSIGVLEAVLAALRRAGEAGVVHRDLKPANLLVTCGGIVKVADFGIAKALDATAPPGWRSSGAIGTPAYMAPEQAAGAAVDPRTDLYAVGVIAYELLTGRPPFDPALPTPALLLKDVHRRPPKPREVNPQLYEGFSDWVVRLLAARPQDRPADAATAWDELETMAVDQFGWRWRDYARLPGDSLPPRAGPRPRASRRVRRRLAAGGLAATCVAAITAAVIALGGGEAPRTHATALPTATATATATEGKPPDAGRVRELLAKLPAATRETCEPDETFGTTQLAKVSCQRWGGSVFFELYADELEARSRFLVDVELAEEDLRGRAETCEDADVGRPFSGTWTPPGRSKADGQILCSFTQDDDSNDGFAQREWIVKGSAVVSTLLFLDDWRTATNGATLAWEHATRSPQ